MSEFRIDQITNQTGTGGSNVAGITTFTGSSGLVLPSGSTSGREGAQFGNENIVRDGLYFHIDAKYSYPTKQSPANGGYIRDLAGNNDLSIHGYPTWDSEDGEGSIVFDDSAGDDQQFAQADRIVIDGDLQKFSVTFWYMLTGGTNGGRGGLFERRPQNYYNGWSFGQGGSSNWSFNVSCADDASTNYVYCVFPFPSSSNGTTWYCDSVSVDRTNATVDYRVTTPYRNGVDIKGTTGQSYTFNGTVNHPNTMDFEYRKPMCLAGRRDNSSPQTLPMKIGAVQIYNRILTPEEHLQNFNALKHRFGY